MSKCWLPLSVLELTLIFHLSVIGTSYGGQQLKCDYISGILGRLEFTRSHRKRRSTEENKSQWNGVSASREMSACQMAAMPGQAAEES